MSKFYIKKLILAGVGKQNSEVEFINGTNIVYGPSNTGKTYILKCIDYLFGSKKNPIPHEHGYHNISVQVISSGHNVTISRKLDERLLTVSSQHPEIRSGQYYLKNQDYTKTISFVWLTMIGIGEQRYIIKNEKFGKQNLTLRTFIHMFMLNEERMISERSIFFSGITTSVTAEFSAFLFLLTGENYQDIDEKDEAKVREIRQEAIVSYIYQEIAEYSNERLELIEKLSLDFSEDSINIEQKMSDIIDNIEATDKELTSALNSNKQLLASVQETNGKMFECELLLNRYNSLISQYNADLHRLSFIVDGTMNIDREASSKCPICDSNIVSEIDPIMIESAKAEYNSILKQTQELKETIHFVEREKHHYETVASELKARQTETSRIINTELKPKMFALKEQIKKYKEYIRYQNEIDFLKQIATKKQAEVFDVAFEEATDEVKYRPREKFLSSQVKEISETLLDLFTQSNFDGLTAASLDIRSMDVVVNGKPKSEYGKGYRAFLNTIFSLSILLYLSRKGVYSPGYAIYDSPILSLKERDDQPTSLSMKSSLFKLFDRGFEGVQLIVIENELPPIEYDNANLIHFTKNTESGRYGLLYGITK